MYAEEIEDLNKWFNDEERRYETSFNGDEYVVSEADVEEFCDFLRERNPDLIGIPCMVGTNGIWFTANDLKKVRYL